MKRIIIVNIFFWLALVVSHAAVVGENVSYSAEGTTMKGYLAYNNAIKGSRPGVLVVHEWWGHDDYARERARMLAELGYVALALDMYGDGKQAAHPEDAGKFASAVKKICLSLRQGSWRPIVCCSSMP